MTYLKDLVELDELVDEDEDGVLFSDIEEEALRVEDHEEQSVEE